MPNNPKKQVYKEKEFGIYVLWKFLPAHFKGMKRDELETLGFTDPMILKIIKIKNQTEFAKYFNIKDLGTLTDWNNRIKREKPASPLLMTEFQKQYSGINERIILPNVSKLEAKISEQNKTISLLKKENALLKKKLKPSVIHKKEKSADTVTLPAPQNTPPEIQQTKTSENKETKNVFSRLKKLFQ